MSNDELPDDFDERLETLVDQLTQEWQLVAEERGLAETDATGQLALFREWATVKIAGLIMNRDATLKFIESSNNIFEMLIEERSQRNS